MCGRFAITLPTDAIAGLFDAEFDRGIEFHPRYNICPTQMIPAIVGTEKTRMVLHMRWGFIPHWYKAPNDGPLLINARSETIAEKPAFRQACRTRRCLIPASGYYEWSGTKEEGKQPWYIFPSTQPIFAMAGIWQEYESEDGSKSGTCAIVTVNANDKLATIHHRMPVIVTQSDFGLWLGERGKGAARLMQPSPDNILNAHPVSNKVNSAKWDNASICVPI